MEPISDRAEIERSVSFIVQPGNVVELRALQARDPTGRHVGTVSGYFTDTKRFVRAAEHWSGHAVGVYFVLNPVLPDLLARACNRTVRWAQNTTADHEIIRRRWLLIDCDPVRPRGISATDAEHLAALERATVVRDHLRSKGFPELLVADSGNGAHVLVGVDLPNDIDTRGKMCRFLETIGNRFTDEIVEIDQSTFNAARLSRLYGTLACKGDEVPDLGRVHRLSRLLEVD